MSKAVLELTLIVLSGGERKQKQQRKWKQEQRKQEQRKQGLSCMRFKTQVQLGISRRRISIKHLGQFPLPLGGPTFREG
jgi:hypothetical protein